MSLVKTKHKQQDINIDKKSGNTVAGSVVLAIIIAMRSLEWLHNYSSSNVGETLSSRLAIPVPLPPAPKSAKIGKGCILPPTDDTLCALCNKPRSNPCASSSGYVFCYMCLVTYLREGKHHQRCPITALPCREQDIIRLYEATET